MYIQKQLSGRLLFYLLAGLFLLAFCVSSLPRPQKVEAAAGQMGVQQITLNPGGGILANGSDGIRFTINSEQNNSWPTANYAGTPGQDAVAYRNTVQYCCSAGAPMLNIGGTLYGQAGPASGSGQNWSSLEVISTSGVTSLGSRTSTTGNSGAAIRYTVVKNSITYTIDRVVSYIYPNDYVNDAYTFTIPDGNAEVVKFYLGGDTAPGSSDSGYGVMLTEPVRSVISLNTSSHIMFGFREVAGSKAFDGATSQHYGTPFGTVASGGNIGFVETASVHDAGLMMQWNLGSTPGTQTASMQQFATQQGTNLNASFASSSTDPDVPVNLNVSIANTELTTVSGLGYTLALPSGLVVGSGSPSNSCGGTLTAVAGSGTISLSGGSVDGASNCISSIPVVSSSVGTYGISSSSFSSLAGALTNNVGASSLIVTSPELGSDLNDDGTDDSSQPNVYSYTSSVTDKTVVLEADDTCTVNSASSVSELSNPVQDDGYTYINGLMDFSLACGTNGFTSIIKQYYYNTLSDELILRKYNPNTETYFEIEDATIEQTTINGFAVTVVTYEVTDGGALDTDGAEDGNISDPAGLASTDSTDIYAASSNENSPGAPATGLARESILLPIVCITAGLLLSAIFIRRQSMYGSKK